MEMGGGICEICNRGPTVIVGCQGVHIFVKTYRKVLFLKLLNFGPILAPL